MELTSSIAIFVIVWWLIFFMILPIGAREVIDRSDISLGQAAGAPKRPRLLLKAFITTLISIAFFGFFYWLFVSGFVAIDPGVK